MKDKLTIEQSRELGDIGVSYDNASEVYVIEGFMGNSYRPCFTLSDVLDIAPANVTDSIGNHWPLVIKKHKEQWSVSYGQIIQFLEKELIDAVFSLIKWMKTEYKEHGN